MNVGLKLGLRIRTFKLRSRLGLIFEPMADEGTRDDTKKKRFYKKNLHGRTLFPFLTRKSYNFWSKFPRLSSHIEACFKMGKSCFDSLKSVAKRSRLNGRNA